MRGGSGVRLWGDVGEVWHGDEKVGLINRWYLDGWNREWRLDAERYRLEEIMNGSRDVRLMLDARVGILEAVGIIWTDFLADGAWHPAIRIMGGALDWKRRAMPAKEAGGVSHR